MKKKKRPPKGTPKWWKEIKCDPEWATQVKARAGWLCEVCGKGHPQFRVNAHHLINKQSVFFRHNLNNGICLCVSCHTLSSEFSAHGTPWKFDKWLKENKPEEFAWWDKNRWLVHTGQSINYEQVYEQLKEGT